MRANHLKWVDIGVILTKQYRKNKECNRNAKRQKKNNIIPFKRK